MPGGKVSPKRKRKAATDHGAEIVLFRLDPDAVAFLHLCLPPIRDLLRGLGQDTSVLDRLLSTAPGQALKGVFEGPSKPLERNLRRAKIEADAELRAFVQARIRTTTLTDLRDAIAATFPPERRVSVSGLHRWWHTYGKHDG